LAGHWRPDSRRRTSGTSATTGRRFGRHGAEVTALGFGAAPLGKLLKPIDDAPVPA
jgi:hypothetical protein